MSLHNKIWVLRTSKLKITDERRDYLHSSQDKIVIEELKRSKRTGSTPETYIMLYVNHTSKKKKKPVE